MLVEWDMSLEPFNSMVKDGTAGPAIEKAIGAIQPEVCYFAARDGKRGGTMVVDLEDASNIPAVAEHLFLAFNANVRFLPCMTPEDLKTPVSPSSARAMRRSLLALACVAGLACAAPRAEETSDGSGYCLSIWTPPTSSSTRTSPV